MSDPPGDSKKLWESIDREIESDPIELGRHASYEYATDPKHLSFVASRYKFAAKLLAGRDAVIEIGCGDGFGTPFVASTVKRLICTDINPALLEDTERRHAFVKNACYEYFDFRGSPYQPAVDAVYLVDVLEHVFLHEEAAFLSNISASLTDYGVALIGTPNKTAEQYASKWSKRAHVNLKTYDSLHALGLTYFHNVFMFGMNDEVVHTGYGPMCHYLWALCVGPRRRGGRAPDL